MSTEKTIEEMEAEFQAEAEAFRKLTLKRVNEACFKSTGSLSAAQAIGAIGAFMEIAAILAQELDADETVLQHLLADAIAVVEKEIPKESKFWSTNPDSEILD